MCFTNRIVVGLLRDRDMAPGRLVFLLGRRPAWLQHLLTKLHLDSRLRLSLCQSNVRVQHWVTDNGGGRVSVLVDEPLVAGDVRVDGAGIASVKMLQLRIGCVVEIGLVCHD